MQNFAKNRNGRAGSPQNGQPQINPQRQVIAANARVPMTKHGVARPSSAQQGLSVRGESVAQHQTASMQQLLQRRPSGEGRQRDPYDTDAESLDTTIDRSVVQVENSPQVDPQQVQPDNEEVDIGGDEEASNEEDEDEGEDVPFNDEINKYLADSNLANASREQQMQFLEETQPQLFPVVDGDSYPSTTDGNPMEEWDEQQEAPSEGQQPGSLSPSPQRFLQQDLTASQFNQQPLQQMPVPGASNANTGMLQNSKLFRHGAQIRAQQRVDDTSHARVQAGQQHDTFHPPTSQPPTYSQVTRDHDFAAAPGSRTRQGVTAQVTQVGLPQRSSRPPSKIGRIQNPVPRNTEPAAPSKHTSTTRTKVVPIIQAHVEPDMVEEPPVFPAGDYDLEVLYSMNYDQLEEESFDNNPHAGESDLTEDMLGKPLPERLHFVQQSFDPTGQSEFFSKLPTGEWEEAGDWFLEQFSTIIQKTRTARQKKRKLAQGFEDEIRERHQHVAKKQLLVEGAMAKMKTQGEGLVPKSPRPSKSPRPRRG